MLQLSPLIEGQGTRRCAAVVSLISFFLAFVMKTEAFVVLPSTVSPRHMLRAGVVEPAALGKNVTRTAQQLRQEAARLRQQAQDLDAQVRMRRKERQEVQVETVVEDRRGRTEQPLENTIESTCSPPTAAATTHTVNTDKHETVDRNFLASLRGPILTAENVTAIQEKYSGSSSKNPTYWFGFPHSHLKIAGSIAWELENHACTNVTMTERLDQFRQDPRLREYWVHQVMDLVVEPVQTLGELRNDYLQSSSSVEKKQLKREIEQLEAKMATTTGTEVTFADDIYLSSLAPLSAATVEQRIGDILALPPVLQALFLESHELVYPDSCDEATLQTLITTAVQLGHYEKQLQVLQQVRFVPPVTDGMRNQTAQAVEALPVLVREWLAAEEFGLDKNTSVERLVERLCRQEDGDEKYQLLRELALNGEDGEESLFKDIEFVDRSRFFSEFFPTLARMEGQHPNLTVVKDFVSVVNDCYRATNKPERVEGGYYIHGTNLLSDDCDGKKLVTKLSEKLAQSDLELDFYYMLNPSPVTDEVFEMGYDKPDPVLFVTSRNRSVTHPTATVLQKAVVTTSALFSLLLFTSNVCGVRSSTDDSAFLTGTFGQVFMAMLGIQLAHELGHRLVAWKDKVEVGMPTPVPSLQLGLHSAITAFRAPPPTMRSVFDVSIAGPALGLASSVGFLVAGLSQTAELSMTETAQNWPGLPVELLRISTLGGSLVELFLGQGVLHVSEAAARIPLHPWALAGFVGLIANALTLLPLGQTDGGRMSHAMLGRRGAVLVKTFSALALCGVGLVGLDNANVFLTYVLLVAIWQSNLDVPARNEVEELDFGRCALGIASAVVVILTLFPLQ